MLELRRQGAVAGDGGPAVVEHLHVGFADVDHRLDGEEHAGAKLRAGARAAGVDDFGAVVEQPAEAVAAKIADDAVAIGLGMALDGVGNVAQAVAGPGLLDPQHQAFIGHVDQFPRLDRHVADQIHAAGVAVPAIEQGRDVHVDDVAVLQDLVAGNAVADDMVDRGAAALGKAAIAQGRGNCPLAQHMVVNQGVERAGGHAGNEVRHQCVEDLGGKAAGGAHSGEAVGAVELDHAGDLASTLSAALTVIYSVIGPK